jgi:hypothetical protein
MLLSKTEVVATFSRILIEEGCCSEIDEATVVVEIILEGVTVEANGDLTGKRPLQLENDRPIIEAMIDNLGIVESDAKILLSKLKRSLCIDDSDNDGDLADAHNTRSEDDDNQDHDRERLEDGECELCDRYIKLTKHHLIPKETWSRIQTKLTHAAEAKRKGELDKAAFLLGPGLENVLDALSTDKASIRGILQDTCDICRQCHSAIHRTHSNMELALHYNTVNKLLEDDSISKFCRWASKQRAGKYKR